MQTLRVAAATARRALLADAVLWSGRGLAAGSGLAILGVAVAKLAALDAGWPLLVGLPVACVLLGALWEWRRRVLSRMLQRDVERHAARQARKSG